MSSVKTVLSIVVTLTILSAAISAPIFSKPDNQVEIIPSLQSFLRIAGYGKLTDPLFDRLKARWDGISGLSGTAHCVNIEEKSKAINRTKRQVVVYEYLDTTNEVARNVCLPTASGDRWVSKVFIDRADYPEDKTVRLIYRIQNWEKVLERHVSQFIVNDDTMLRPKITIQNGYPMEAEGKEKTKASLFDETAICSKSQKVNLSVRNNFYFAYDDGQDGRPWGPLSMMYGCAPDVCHLPYLDGVTTWEFDVDELNHRLRHGTKATVFGQRKDWKNITSNMLFLYHSKWVSFLHGPNQAPSYPRNAILINDLMKMDDPKLLQNIDYAFSETGDDQTQYLVKGDKIIQKKFSFLYFHETATSAFSYKDLQLPAEASKPDAFFLQNQYSLPRRSLAKRANYTVLDIPGSARLDHAIFKRNMDYQRFHPTSKGQSLTNVPVTANYEGEPEPMLAADPHYDFYHRFFVFQGDYYWSYCKDLAKCENKKSWAVDAKKEVDYKKPVKEINVDFPADIDHMFEFFGTLYVVKGDLVYKLPSRLLESPENQQAKLTPMAFRKDFMKCTTGYDKIFDINSTDDAYLSMQQLVGVSDRRASASRMQICGSGIGCMEKVAEASKGKGFSVGLFVVSMWAVGVIGLVTGLVIEHYSNILSKFSSGGRAQANNQTKDLETALVSLNPLLSEPTSPQEQDGQ
ncbi:hypothetical protein HDE_03688 [Halotydeus destructor]|nr:hypothetical protein HDE_03688 [Halotydeus destructor]